MFSRLATLLPIAALVAVAAAAPGGSSGGSSSGSSSGGSSGSTSCSTENQSCCNTNALTVRYLFPSLPLDNSRIHFSQNGESYTLGVLGVLTGTALTAGVQCTALSVLSLGGQSCAQQTVCCDGNTGVSLYHALFHPPLAIRTDTQ